MLHVGTDVGAAVALGVVDVGMVGDAEPVRLVHGVSEIAGVELLVAQFCAESGAPQLPVGIGVYPYAINVDAVEVLASLESSCQLEVVVGPLPV